LTQCREARGYSEFTIGSTLHQLVTSQEMISTTKAIGKTILKGWKKVFTANGVTYWRRPGKDTGISATTGKNDANNLYVFSTSTTFEENKPYSKFAAFAHLEHGDDFSAAARDVAI
jgi:hypothetical protein